MRILIRLLAASTVVAAGLFLAGPRAGADTVVVTIGSGLDPRALTIPQGTTVEWRNADGDRHRVRTSDDAVELDSGNLEPGESFAFTFSVAGTFPYLDDRDRSDASYHGTITVTAPSSSGGGDPGGTPTDGGGAASPPSTASVSILDRSFSPSSIAVAPGGTVTWTNSSDRDHTVTARARSTAARWAAARRSASRSQAMARSGTAATSTSR